jgi:hypothetical protein
MGKIARTWSLMSESWQVLKQDKSLLVFPLMSGICCLLLMISFAIPLYETGDWKPPVQDAGSAHQVIYIGTLFLFYFCNYFIIVFFNSAIIACAAARMSGGNPTIGDGLRAAGSRLPVIAAWALISATVGLVLRLIEDRSDKIVQVIASILGLSWTVMSFLVVPILVVENKNPFVALKDSAAMLKQTWGERAIARFSFSSIFALMALPAIGLIIFGFHLGAAVGITCTALAVIYLIVLSLVHTALQAIFQTAIYLYARDGQVPEGFNAEVLGTALR